MKNPQQADARGVKQVPSQVSDKDHALDHWIGATTPLGTQAGLLLQAIIDSSDDAIISKDLNGFITSWNLAAERMFGYKSEEIVGKNILTIIPPEYKDDEPLILGKIRSGQRIEHFETVRMHKDGRPINISLSVSPIRDRDGKVIGAAKIARDITQQRKTQEDAQRLAALVESSDDAIISKDLEGIIQTWNPAAERMFGYTAAEAVGKSVLLLIPPELQNDEPVILRKIRSGERIEHFQTVRLHKSGHRLQVSLTVSPVRDHGRIIGAAKIVRDVTKQKELETALHTSERLASVGRLAATIAHEINNPLEAVTNFIYLARQTPDLPASVQEYLKIADHELSRVAHVAQQTLGFYRDNTKPITVDVSRAAEDVLTIFGRKMKYKDLHCEKRVRRGLAIQTLQGQLKQVMLNLLANAIDASAQGGRIIIAAHLAKRLRHGRDTLVLSVADTGTGIEKNDREKVFEPFFTTKKDVGTGLGLWITRDLIERRGGHIRFKTRTGKESGTVMTAFIPVDIEQAAITAA